MRRELKKIMFEFRKMYHLLFVFLLGNLFLTTVLQLLPKSTGWSEAKGMQTLFFLIAVFYLASVCVFLIFVFTSLVRHFTSEYYLLEQLNGTSIYRIFIYKLPVNLFLYGFIGLDYYGINMLLPKYLSDSPSIFMHTTSQAPVLLVEGLIFGPIFVAFVYLWMKSFLKYLAGFNTIIISLVMSGILDSIDGAAWEICAVELILSALMLRKSQRIALSEYDQT